MWVKEAAGWLVMWFGAAWIKETHLVEILLFGGELES